MRTLLICAVAISFMACGDPPGGEALDAGGSTVVDAGAVDAGIGDAGPSITVDRGPTPLTFAGDPEGLWWDAPSSTLFVADQENNQILTWTDADAFHTYAVLPGGAQAGQGLGQVVVTPEGLVAVASFGFGTNGTIDLAFPDGGAVAVTGLDPTFRRLGLARTDDGALYESYFVKTGAGSAPIGSVARVVLTEASGTWSGVETEVVTGLQKPVGVVARGGTLYISDQGLGELLSAPIAGLPTAAPTVIASALSLDLISLGPDDTFFTGSTEGALNQLDASGNETAFVSGYAQPRGSAYDAAHTRVFFGNHLDSVGENQLVIAPVTP